MREMKLSKNGRRQHTPSIEELRNRGLVRRAAERPTLTTEQRAIIARYGPVEAVLAAFRPEMVCGYSRDYEMRLQRPLPALVTLEGCYPDSPGMIRAIILNLVTGTVLALGEESRVDEADRKSIARGLCGNPGFRTLSMTSVLQFFYRLQTGAIECDGWLRPAKFLKLANAWAREAREAEHRAAVNREHERRRHERLDREAGHTSWSERWERYKATHGLDPSLSYGAWLEQQRREGMALHKTHNYEK